MLRIFSLQESSCEPEKTKWHNMQNNGDKMSGELKVQAEARSTQTPLDKDKGNPKGHISGTEGNPKGP